LSLATAEGDDHSLRAIGFDRQCQTGPLHLAVPLKASSANIEPVDKDRGEPVIAQVRHIEAKKPVCRSADAILVSPTHYIEGSGGGIDDRCAGNTPLGMNSHGFEFVEILPRHRIAEGAHRKLLARIGVKGKYCVVHRRDVDDAMHPARDIDVRSIEWRALNFAVDTHHKPPMELIRTGANIYRRQDRLSCSRTRAEGVIAALEHIARPQCLRTCPSQDRTNQYGCGEPRATSTGPFLHNVPQVGKAEGMARNSIIRGNRATRFCKQLATACSREPLKASALGRIDCGVQTRLAR
jgi:hypothetical protein